MLAIYPKAITGVHFRCPSKGKVPRAAPIRAAPAAEPIARMLPAVPDVRVTSLKNVMDVKQIIQWRIIFLDI